jgi:soluble lytic murein transglycosylase
VIRRRRVLLLLLLAAVAVALALGVPTERGPSSAAPGAPGDPGVAAFADSGDPLLQRLAAHARARTDGDLERLVELMSGDDVAAFRAAQDLADHPDAGPALRRDALERVLALRIDEPLARRERTALLLALGAEADAAGDAGTAREAYLDALPDPRAADALADLISDPYRLSAALLEARLHERALDALGELAAPSIEAPALRALGRYDEALDAYRRWLEQVPDSRTARFGLAWSHWFLGDLDAAEAVFAALGGSDADYGRALIANRRGDVGEAARLLTSTGVASRLWLATTLLEQEGRVEEAVEVYLRLARGGSDYADDAAWRVRVLGLRADRPDWLAAGDAALPATGFFASLLGAPAAGPTRDDLADAEPAALARARTLAEVGDESGARLVLSFALREARAGGADEATVVALGEALAALGEYRQPQRAAAAFLAAGSEQYRTWRIAYPEAWPDRVRLEAKHAGVDPHLVWAVMRRESAFFPDAISRSGAQGLMQVMPATWDWLAEVQDETPDDPFDIDANIRYGTVYLGWLQEYFAGDELLVVPSYNRGQGYIRRLYDDETVRRDKDELFRRIDAHETREYLQAVLAAKATYDALAAFPARADGALRTPASR